MSEMSENTLERAAADILASALETVGAAKDFVLAELPDVVQQLLLWKATYSLIWFVVCMAGLLVCYLVYRRMNTWVRGAETLTPQQQKRLDRLSELGYSRRSSFEDREYNRLSRNRASYSGTQYLALIPAPFLLVAAISDCTDWLQIWLAPKVYLIEYASSLVK